VTGSRHRSAGPENPDVPQVVPADDTAEGRERRVTDPLRALLRASHLLAPDDLAATVAAHATAVGLREVVLYLVDYAQATLHPLPGAGVPERQQLPIEGTMAGRAFRRVDTVTSTAIEGTYRMWLPLLDGAERLGVVELDLAREPSDELMDDIQALVTLAAELVVANHACSDVFSRLRRCKTLSLAAEMQWELLPPLTLATERGRHRRRPGARLRHRGDSFDYAVNGSTADLAIFN
jgi:hypothetical protein